MLKITTTKKKIFSVRYIKLKSTNHLLNLFQESASTTVPTIRSQKRLESKSPMAPTLQVKQFAIGLKGLDLKRVLEKFIHVNHSLHKLLTPQCRYTIGSKFLWRPIQIPNYSMHSIKCPVLSNDLIWFFSKSIY